MGRTLAEKKALVADIKTSLDTATLAFAINYRGLTVSEITDLRTRLRPKGAVCKVSKNTLMGKAIEGNEKWSAMEPLLKDTAAFILVQEDVGGAVKAYKEFQKATKKTEVLGAVMDGKLLTAAQFKEVEDLPSKEQLYSQIAGAVNSIVSNIAVLVQEIPTGVARAVQAVADKQAA
jgi:large subunit ribosomal protein L10